ncbi:MAG: DUF501 domain-containing protein [Actinomycetaceae bacterium]|nr:DUF501 domain-containing protein [Actinomycetaceae bacterium]
MVDDLARIAASATPLREGDAQIIEAQLGRPARGLIAIGARCACGRPAVTVTAPRLPDGTPFPTLFYLTLPQLVYAMSRLEAEGFMAELAARLRDDEELAAAHARAHTSYLQRRRLLEDVPEIAGVSAGGMPGRVKCLHALAGYAMSAGPGVCPVGDIALEKIGWDRTVCTCENVGGE